MESSSVFSNHGILPEELVNHLFFPKRLPNEEEGTIASIEVALLEYMEGIITPILHKEGLFLTTGTFKNWTRVQNHGRDLQETLNQLKPEDSACLYVRKQNCTIHFTKLDDKHMRIITFRSSLPNEYVTGTCGSVKVSYPETVNVVPISPLLLSSCFSKQLESLVVSPCDIALPAAGEGEERKVKQEEPSDPHVISDFLVSLLYPFEVKCEGNRANRNHLTFQKKVRDQVNWNKVLLPFRRSGLWMSAKVILQLSLREEMDTIHEATVMYKIIILRILNALAYHYTNWTVDPCWDVTAQIMAKLARRTKKLADTMETEEFEELKKETIKMSTSTIDSLHGSVSAQWKSLVFPDHYDDVDDVNDASLEVKLVRQTKENWKTDRIHKMEELAKHLNCERLSGSGMEPTENLKMIDPFIQTKTASLDVLLKPLEDASADQQDVHLNKEANWIYQTEWFVRHRLTINHPSGKIAELMTLYFDRAFKLYGTVHSDPVYYSRMTITYLKFIAVLDEIAVIQHPLLGEYKTGINSEIFPALLITDKEEMKMVKMLENYFEERNSTAIYDFWIKYSSVSKDDFCVEYADRNERMQHLQKEILEKMEKKIAAKKREVQKAIKKCNELQEEISQSNCSYTWDRLKEKNVHDSDCNRCILRAELKKKRKSVKPYRRPLPAEEYLRSAVIFELGIPQDIAALRDGVVRFLEETLGHRCFQGAKRYQTRWTMHSDLSKSKTGHQSVYHLGSFQRSSYSTGENPDVLLEPESAFILENRLSCGYYRTPGGSTPKNAFTFQISNTGADNAAAYECLQFALEIKRPTENEVLAKQYECHQDLTLKEFQAFGSLRCAHRVQLRNLYAELAGKTLSIDKEPVVQLIMQTLWELGPGTREIHDDFESEENIQFARAFLHLLKTYGEENGTNWSSPMVLLSLGMVAVRILEMNDSPEVKLDAAQVLQRYRDIAEAWCTKLEELQLTTGDSKDAQELKSYLLKSALSTVFTFNVTTTDNLAYVISTGSDITHLMKALFRLHHLIVRENILEENEPSRFLGDLLRHARHGIPLNVQSYLHVALANPSFNLALHHFAASKWLDARSMAPSEIPYFVSCGSQCFVKRHAYQARYPANHLVCVDTIRGTFFVDGYPPSLLPETIIRHPLFQTFFCSSQFQVQRVGRTFKTTEAYHGHQFEFTEGHHNRLIIRQLSGVNRWYELIPRDFLDGRVPHDLVDNYTHWFDLSGEELYFCRTSTETLEDIERFADYKMVPRQENRGRDLPKEWLLHKYDGSDETSRVFLLSINSDGFKKIANNLRRLENANFIHVQGKFEASLKSEEGKVRFQGSQASEKLKISARLWRHNLSFSLGDYGYLHCDNYPGYRMPQSRNGGQSLGTLVGLEIGIVLEKKTAAEQIGVKKLFLVQHGTLLGENNGKHQRVITSSETVKNPTYFVFEVDNTLQRLCPGKSKSAWLYLAALHAATSSPWPDPFTHLTGVEMAVWILQSAYIWSCSPYNKECTEILLQISALSPVYMYPPEHKGTLQTVQWPKGLAKNAYAAYDGYVIIVEKLFKDSQRLAGLFLGKEEEASKFDLNMMPLTLRSYYRNINMYNKAAHLTSQFVTDVACSSDFLLELESGKPATLDPEELVTFAKYRWQKIPSPLKVRVKYLIMTPKSLPLAAAGELTKEYLAAWFQTPFRDNWLHIYALSLKQTERNLEHELTFLFGALLYAGDGIFDQLLNLHNVTLGRVNGMAFPDLPISLTGRDYKPLNGEFERLSIMAAITQNAEEAPLPDSFQSSEEFKEAKAKHDKCLDQQAKESCSVIKSYWPREEITPDQFSQAVGHQSLLRSILDTPECPGFQEINKLFKIWYNNYTLKEFIERVDDLLGRQRGLAMLVKIPLSGSLRFEGVPNTADRWPPEYFETPNDLSEEMEEVIRTGQLKFKADPSRLYAQRKECMGFVEKYFLSLRRILVGECGVRDALNKAGLHDRLAPGVLLREKFGGSTEPQTGGNLHVRALAVVWAHLRRVNRLIMYEEEDKMYSVELVQEQKTRAFEEWNPFDNPEWLLLELELDITIRPIQVQVARQMMVMPDEKNGVMQLNMGEGKTSVIIPMIVASLSARIDLICRVNVLDSIFATNFNLLGAAIGGLINKRLYSVPCSRDLNVSQYLDKIQRSYEECLELGGAIITLPEYRLSFRLQKYCNFLQNGKEELGQRVDHMEAWLCRHVRDLVDESDEIFNVKFQLIYTTGKQLQIDGGSLRWAVCQKLLEFVPQVAPKLLSKFGDNVIEFKPTEAAEKEETFTHFRIAGEEAKHDLNELMADGVLDGKIKLIGCVLKPEERELIKEFLTNEAISEVNHLRFLEEINLSEEKKQALLLVSGYLRRGILFMALKKRWRVDYGVKKVTPGAFGKLMAVPFRGKDVAAERTEFGHPDVAILLTQLSYFYSGLNDNQLIQCFHVLTTRINAPETVYNSWIRSIPPDKVHDSVTTYQGINLKDYEQRKKHLFPILEKHRSVVNFYLENVVFPMECKQFPGKLVTNAWDLCYERCTHPTTGFSGTNDTSLLLPVQITQQDLPILVETNATMEETLRREENEWKRSLEMGVTCKEVLEFMIKDNLQVLLDAGALMLQLGNEEIAQLWLDLDKSLQGVVYFDEAGDMLIKIRRFGGYHKWEEEKDAPLALSPFKDNLEKCAVYLDDQHTRGTDVRLPTNFKACVTVGTDMRRDKLIQSCMRMRKLGQGQCVNFYLSHEVHNKIRQGNQNSTITVNDIITWTKSNSEKFEKDGLVYWATNARNYAKNLAADHLYELSDKMLEDGVRLGRRCEDPDAQTLDKMYGSYHRQALVTSVVPSWFRTIPKQLIDESYPNEVLPLGIPEMVEDIRMMVLAKCEDHIPEVYTFHNMLEEEQEKELEPEQEVEQQKYRPPQETPAVPALHENVKNCVLKKNKVSAVKGISKLSDIFMDTSIKGKLQGNGWGKDCYASDDFIKVVKKSSNSRMGSYLDSFLKRIRFLVSFKMGAGITVLLLSQYEVNQLITDLKEGRCCSEATLHMLSGRWMEGQPTFVNNTQLQLPTQTRLSEDLVAPLLVATGNLYFDGVEEQKAFAAFLGLRLRPWTTEEEEAFKNKKITSSGFVLPSCRQLREGCNFQKDPTEMVMGILKVRNDVLRETDHVVTILDTCAYID